MFGKAKIMILTACGISLFLLSACSKSSRDASWGASCSVYLEHLPEGYDLLSRDIREHIKISVSLRNTASNKNYRTTLSEKNKYRQDIDMVPGTYEVYAHMSDQALAMFDVNAGVPSIEITKASQTPLPVSVSNPEEYAATANENLPSEEILSADTYSRKVQFSGSVIDLNQVPQLMQFKTEDSKRLSPAETAYIPSSSNNGVSMIVQNQTGASISASEAAFVGVRFTKNNVVFPKGVRIGMSVSEAAHAKHGILGTPGYCLGTPMLGTGYDNTTLVYPDPVSGDRLSLSIGPEDSFIRSISYEFEKFE